MRGIETKQGGGQWQFRWSAPLVALLAVIALSGCSSVPDEINPAEWYKSATGEEKTETTPPPGRESDFPKASRVEQQVAARDNRSGGLTADVEGRKYADAIPRQGTDSENSLYKDAPPAAPNVEASQPAPPPPAPATPVVSAPAPAPVPAPMPTPAPTRAPQMAATPEPTPAPAQATASNSQEFGVEGMRDRLAQQLVEIRARAADQGSLMPQDLAYGSDSQPTIVVSSAGIEQQQASSLSVFGGDGDATATLPNNFGGAARIDNDGALPLPVGSKKIATILFNNGSAALDTNDRRILADVVRLQRESGSKVRVIGHASQRTANMDFAQHKSTNLQVSARRANQIADELRKLGIPNGSILVAAVGDNQPQYLEIMPSGEAGNRRAEIYFSN